MDVEWVLAGLLANMASDPAHQNAHDRLAACAVAMVALEATEREYMSVEGILSSQV
jgi:hypothetical protein